MSKPGGDPSSGISLGDVLRRPERHPACRRREARPGFRMERENLFSDVKGQATSGSNREGESTEADIRIVKNPFYWNAGTVAIETVVFDPTENLATVLKRYRAGEFDIIINGLPNDQLGWLKQNMPKELHVVPYANIGLYSFNTAKPP